MTVHLATFSDESMSRSRALCIEAALKHGVDSVAGPHYFDPHLEYRDGFTFEWLRGQPIFSEFNDAFWSARGCGYFIWKPYIIEQVMSKVPDGDYLVYSDAGVEFINSIRYITDRMDQDIFLFGNNWEHAHWCKRDVIDAIFSTATLPDYTHWTLPIEWGVFGKQAQASVIVIRVSEWSREFVDEWLEWCQMAIYSPPPFRVKHGYLIDDSPSLNSNHPEFREHRHDQAILTTLAYREGIKLHYWPAMYNDGAFVYEKLPEYAGDEYPILFHHHRRRGHEWEQVA